tara:strand:+ start:951 stop:2021 length:1071 start_codon:yes stop_codon:yes gene_type:complete
MADFNLSLSTTTDFTNTVPDFIVEAMALDVANATGETFWYFSEAQKNFGYYLQIPEIYSAANALATWAFGNGWETPDIQMKEILKHVVGMGKDTFTKIIYNHEIVKLIVGDAFIEVVKEKDIIINMIPISPERVRVVFGKTGLIKRYDVWNGRIWKSIKKENMIHSQNKRIGDQLHGTSQIDAAKFIIDARNEALADERVIKHRDKALGVVYYKTNNAGKISFANEQIEKAVKNGEMVGMPEDTAKIEPYPSRSSEDRQAWISYLENFFYQVFGVPRSIATSDGTSEVGGKMGNVNFEPTYAKEVIDMEEDLLNQQGIEITFPRQDKLGGLQETEQKNTGQTSIQPNDVEASLTRE